MEQISIGSLPPDIAGFVRTLASKGDGVEIVEDGKVIWRLVPPTTRTDSEREAIVARGREILAKVRERVKNVPQDVLDREIEVAIEQARRLPSQ